MGARSARLRRTRLSAAVSAVIAGAAAGTATGAIAAEIETVVVTATKRSESAQDVAVALQAVSGDTLRELGIETFDKYVEYLPNVVSAGNGPGQKEIYIRGSATEQSAITVSGVQSSAPGVALYVDEQPVSFGARNLDFYAVDLERIEVLSGPQGTLFGASSQAGNLRLITKKPVYGKFGVGLNGRYSSTDGGANSGAVDAYINLPLSERLAARVAIYSDTQGGWVDNKPAVFTPNPVLINRSSIFGTTVTGDGAITSANNDNVALGDWNTASYRGARASLAYDLNDDWEVLIQHTAQTLEVEGSFLVDPSLGQDHATARFAPEYNRDEFGLTAWTLSGRLANLDAVYTGGHLHREVDSVIDYTHYNNGGGYIAYYLCGGAIYDATAAQDCYNPTKQFRDDTRNVRTTHELRITTDPGKRWRALGGVYFNDMETNHVGDFQYASASDAFSDASGIGGFQLGNITIDTAGVNTSGPRGPLTVFFNDYTRTEEEVALFGELAVDISARWGASLSARRYDLTSRLQGASNFSFGCRAGIGSDAEATADGRCNGTGFSNDVSARLRALGRYNASADDQLILNARSPNGARDLFRGGGSNQATLDAIKAGHIDIGDLESDGSISETDTIIKASLNWRPVDDVLLFANYAEGYRPATQNRNAGQLAGNQSGVYENYAVPAVAVTDDLDSYELGMKGDFLDGSLRLNATLYRSEVTDLQVARFDPTNVAFLVFIENVGDAEVRGLDIDYQWVASYALSFAGAVSFTDTELTRLSPQLRGIAVPVGAELPLSPKFSGNLRVRYDFTIKDLGDAYVSASVNYRGESVSGVTGDAAFKDDSLFQQTGRYSGLKLRREGGTYGTVEISDGPGSANTRLPANSRFINPAALTFNVAFGVARDDWQGELFIDNVNNEQAPVAQVAGNFVPVVTVRRPRTIGLRISYDLE